MPQPLTTVDAIGARGTLVAIDGSRTRLPGRSVSSLLRRLASTSSAGSKAAARHPPRSHLPQRWSTHNHHEQRADLRCWEAFGSLSITNSCPELAQKRREEFRVVGKHAPSVRDRGAQSICIDRTGGDDPVLVEHLRHGSESVPSVGKPLNRRLSFFVGRDGGHGRAAAERWCLRAASFAGAFVDGLSAIVYEGDGCCGRVRELRWGKTLDSGFSHNACPIDATILAISRFARAERFPG